MILEGFAKRKNVNPEYKKKMLLACKRSEEMNYKMSPYELDFVSNVGGF